MLSFGCLGMYVGGLLCDHWLRKGVAEGPLKVATLSAIGAGSFLGLAMLMPNPYVALALMGPGLFFQAMPIGTVYAGVQLIFPNQIRGQASALFMFILNFGGIGLGPLLPGVLNDHFFKNERMVGPSVSITVVFASLCMLVILPLTYRHYRRDYIALNSASRRRVIRQPLSSRLNRPAGRNIHVGTIQLRNRLAAEQRHRAFEIGAENCNCSRDACLSRCAQAVHIGAADQHGPRAEADCFRNVAAAADAAIDQHLGAAADCGHNFRQRAQRAATPSSWRPP